MGLSDCPPLAQPRSSIPHEPPPVDLSDFAPPDHGRGSRRVKRWLAEQQLLNADSIFLDASSSEQIAKAAGTPCNPYLAYPNLAYIASSKGNDDDDKACFVRVSHSLTILLTSQMGW